MAAKLEWRGTTLMLGDFLLAEVRQLPTWWRYRIHAIPLRESPSGAACEQYTDVREECERKVRRLLREAGVEVDPS